MSPIVLYAGVFIEIFVDNFCISKAEVQFSSVERLLLTLCLILKLCTVCSVFSTHIQFTLLNFLLMVSIVHSIFLEKNITNNSFVCVILYFKTARAYVNVTVHTMQKETDQIALQE